METTCIDNKLDTIVTVYSKEDCSSCAVGYRQLLARGVDFTIEVVTNSSTALSELKALGYTMAPVFAAGDQHWGGVHTTNLFGIIAEIAGTTGPALDPKSDYVESLVKDIKKVIDEGAGKIVVVSRQLILEELHTAA